jgi:hypothetical protein
MLPAELRRSSMRVTSCASGRSFRPITRMV